METYRISEIENIQNYILGGRAEFVIEDLESKAHITFTVRQDAKDETRYFVKYKSLDLKYIGIVKTKLIEFEGDKYNMPFFYPDKKHILTDNDREKQDIFAMLIKFIYYIELIPENINILHTGRCSICSRVLNDPESIRIGIGPVCRANQ